MKKSILMYCPRSNMKNAAMAEKTIIIRRILFLFISYYFNLYRLYIRSGNMTHYYAWYYSNFQCFQDNEKHVINHMRLAQAGLLEFLPANSDIIQIIVISP